MEIILSAAISLDGHLDDRRPERLKLSSPEDWDAVLELRASCDAILVGATTVRADNPSLVIRDGDVRRKRISEGMDEDLMKVTVTASGDLDPGAAFFREGGGRKIVFAPASADAQRLRRLENYAEVITGNIIDARFIARHLEKRGCRRLMVEGGSQMHTMFLTQGMADRLRLAVAPMFVGDQGAPRFVNGGNFPWNKENRMTLEGVEMLGDTAVLKYAVERVGTDYYYLQQAVNESRKCVPDSGAYSVGAVILTASGNIFKGYTHETGRHNHAEEEALAKAVAAGAELKGATIYCSMEPCSTRKSKPVSCSELIIGHGLSKVVYALGEPPVFVDCCGADNLSSAGTEVIRIDSLAPEVEEINRHILK